MTESKFKLTVFLASHGWAMCSKCKGPVEKMEAREIFETRSLRVTAICHGEAEHVDIPYQTLADEEAFSFNGEAFKERRALVDASPKE